ncbi:MAG: hypothetical protein IKM02_02210 [Clostridia bacterium]|nr:hypothetical protein [Clostridia bacterium]
MKKSTVILAIVFALLALTLAVYFIGGTLSAQVQVITAPAGEYPEAYKSIVNVIESGSAPTYFTQEDLSDISRYTLMDVTIHLSNPGLFPAEWLDITAGGIPGDVAVYSLTGEGSTVDARSGGQVNLKLITAANAAAPRTYTIEYYVLGMKRSVRVS